MIKTRTDGTTTRSITAYGHYALALASTVLGCFMMFFDEFASVWQPVPDGLPMRSILAYIYGAIFVLSGLLSLSKSYRKQGNIGIALAFGLDAIALHLPRIIGSPLVFNFWSSFGEQIAVASAAVTLVTEGDSRFATLRTCSILVFGTSVLGFGAAHFIYLDQTAKMVPHAFTPHLFWATATGMCHIAAGIAILSGLFRRTALWLLTMMCLMFGILVHLPSLIEDYKNHFWWFGNAVNFTLVAATWVFADAEQMLIMRRRQSK